MIRSFIIIFWSAICCCSCNKFLDVKPKGTLIPAEIGEFSRLLDNEETVQSFFLDNNNYIPGSMIGYMTDDIALSENLGSIRYKALNNPNIERYYGYIYRAPYRNPVTRDFFWELGVYGAIKYFNNVIDGITAVKNSGNAAEADKVLAQAYAARAWVYLHTALVYGPVYKPGSNNSTPTIPYVTSSDISTPVPGLSTQEEVFKKVLADLHQALPYAPSATNYPSRANKAATQAMLAYYHLFTRRYDSVVYYSNLAWAGTTATGGAATVLYDYNTLSYADPSNLIYSGIISPDNKIQLPVSKEILFYRLADNSAGMIDDSYPSDEFVSLFDQTSDLRYKYYLMTAPGYQTVYNGNFYDDGARVQYFRGGPTFGSSPRFQMTAGFTYPEVLLMRAEGYARMHQLPEAMADLNTLRRFRFKTGTPDLTMPATEDEVIQLVLQERRRELPLGHLKRFMDLKRFCLDQGKPWSKTKITHRLGSNTYEGVVDSKDFILSISNSVLKFNPQWGIPLDTRPF
jgi:hypothetical protein